MKILFVTLSAILLSLSAQLNAQTTNHTFKAMKATNGTGLHKGKIYWISWDLDNKNTAGDKLGSSVSGKYTSPAGYTYEIKLTRKSGALVSASTTDYGQNSFPVGYTAFTPSSTILGIKQDPAGSTASFALEVKSKDPLGNVGIPKGLVIAGSESLSGTSEYYTLKTSTGLVRLIDKYIYNNNWNSFNVQLQVSDGGKTIKATQKNSDNGDGKGDVMLFAEGVSSIDVELKGGGGQHIALGFMEDIDHSDAPSSYGVAYHVLKSSFTDGTFGNSSVNINTLSNTADIASSSGQLAKSGMPELYLGSLIDGDAYPTKFPISGSAPDGDDLSGDDDEDALPNNPLEIDFNAASHNVTIPYTNNSTSTAYLTLWIDKNRNGIFDDNEKIVKTITPKTNGNMVIDLKPLTIPLGAKYYTRLRFSTQANLVPTGFAPDGEVEDHFINFYAIPYNIYGNIFLDKDRGTPNGEDFNGVTVSLYRNSNSFVESVISENGSYYFKDLPLGNYEVRVTLPSAEYEHVSSSDSTPTDGRTSVAVVDSNIYGVDFGLYYPVCYRNPSVLSGGQPVNHGITALGRAGVEDNWPMARKGAWTALESKNTGFVINRVAADLESDGGQVPSITVPVIGMMIYDTTNNCLKIYNGTSWNCFSRITCPD